MSKKIIALLCGGKSAEHEISLCSAWNFLKGIDHNLFSIILIGIDKNGNWNLENKDDLLGQEPKPKSISLKKAGGSVMLLPGNNQHKLFSIKQQAYLPNIDVVFPLLHGPNGEDGTIQGLLEQLQLPYVGPRLLGAAICMDKDVAKRLMQYAGIPTSAFVSCHVSQKANLNFEEVNSTLGLPLFVKPANMGSSVGINKVSDAASFNRAIEEAFQFDEKIIIEEFVEGQEVECAILGNEDFLVSVPGTYTHADDFFAYDTKYLKDGEVLMEMPAKMLNQQQIDELQTLALKAYNALECKGMARVDIFVTPDGTYLVNEINTIPGFTQYSMYPLLMEHSGKDYNSLISSLCELANSSFNLKK